VLAAQDTRRICSFFVEMRLWLFDRLLPKYNIHDDPARLGHLGLLRQGATGQP
jgi:hypothetical protein